MTGQQEPGSTTGSDMTTERTKKLAVGGVLGAGLRSGAAGRVSATLRGAARCPLHVGVQAEISRGMDAVERLRAD